MNFLNKIMRRVQHLHKSGSFVIGLEHFLVMFPSAMLVAKLANTSYGAVVELTSVLFVCGMGTFLFALFTTFKIPFFLGPSFAYIGFVSYQVAKITSPNDMVIIRSTIFYGYLFAGALLIFMSILYRFQVIKDAINTIFPSTVMGPAISLIGLELANMAAEDSGFTGNRSSLQILSIVTLICIIVFSLIRYHFFQNASVFLGVMVGCIVATLMEKATWPRISMHNMQFRIPRLYLDCFRYIPDNWIPLVISIIPCTIIAFIESLGRITVYRGMIKRDSIEYDDEIVSNKAISKHAYSNAITSILGMMPNAIYAENLAIMNLHNADFSTKKVKEEDDDSFINKCYSPYSIYPYMFASGICILVACFSGLQEVFIAIPTPILGGMELFVFGLIAAPGIQMLVEQQVNYKKISNQIITASVLLAGISNISITYETLTLKGMSLGLVIGVVVNLLTLILRYFGYLNEKFTLIEVLDECVDKFYNSIDFKLYDEESSQILEKI